MQLNPDQIQGYIAVAAGLAALGAEVGAQLRRLIKAFHPDAILSEEQINAIEAAGIADSERRRNERIAMGMPST